MEVPLRVDRPRHHRRDRSDDRPTREQHGDCRALAAPGHRLHRRRHHDRVDREQHDAEQGEGDGEAHPGVDPQEGEDQHGHCREPEQDHRPPTDAVRDGAHDGPRQDPEQCQQPQVEPHCHVGVAEILAHVEHEERREREVCHTAQRRHGDEREHRHVAEQWPRRREVLAKLEAHLPGLLGRLEAREDDEAGQQRRPDVQQRHRAPVEATPLQPGEAHPAEQHANDERRRRVPDRAAGAVRGDRERSPLGIAHGQLGERRRVPHRRPRACDGDGHEHEPVVRGEPDGGVAEGEAAHAAGEHEADAAAEHVREHPGGDVHRPHRRRPHADDAARGDVAEEQRVLDVGQEQ